MKNNTGLIVAGVIVTGVIAFLAVKAYGKSSSSNPYNNPALIKNGYTGVVENNDWDDAGGYRITYPAADVQQNGQTLAEYFSSNGTLMGRDVVENGSTVYKPIKFL